ncbi:MAG TPA: hypothetical protein VFM80_09490 [Gracilimonas sp.]|uniref:hypothetical protein n=1 Tax=Gracilimonas sp. TaxID=1974203 RepID=UPI002D8CC650|nr:hypothetical protein [Gracilimonas sp.]
MKFSLLKIDKISGDKSSFYTVQMEEGTILFDRFINENSKLHEKEIRDILQRIRAMAHRTGAQEHFFKLHEGKPGDGVCALYDEPDANLRLYCIRFGSAIVIIGGGGLKEKIIREFQQNKKLTDENYLLREISAEITDKMKSGEIRFSDDELEFIGNLDFI